MILWINVIRLTRPNEPIRLGESDFPLVMAPPLKPQLNYLCSLILYFKSDDDLYDHMNHQRGVSIRHMTLGLYYLWLICETSSLLCYFLH